MGRSTYLTVRCPTGCEAWLHPHALHAHVEGGRCRGHPWVDDLPDTAVIPHRYAPMLLGAVDESLLGVVDMPASSRVYSGDGRRRTPAPPTRTGTLDLRSPLDGVSAGRWLAVATAAVQRWGPDGVRQALDTERFVALAAELLPPDAYIDCPICGAFVSAKGLGSHQTASAACWWRQAAAKVRCAWRDGWRDPWSVPQAPKTWHELSRATRWKRRVHTIAFPRWIAVLLPYDNSRQRRG